MAERQAGLLYTPKGVFVSVELRMLTFSVVLGIVQIIAASHAASLQRGYRWTASPRDEKVEPLRGVAGRLDRALRNFLETFPLFAAVVLIAHLTDTHDALTEWGARLYFWAPVGPFAGMERCHDRHRVNRHCPTLEVSVYVIRVLGRRGLTQANFGELY